MKIPVMFAKSQEFTVPVQPEALSSATRELIVRAILDYDRRLKRRLLVEWMERPKAEPQPKASV